MSGIFALNLAGRLTPHAWLCALTPRSSSALLTLGLVCFAGGILLMFQHRREWLGSFRGKVDPQTRRFEDRKFRRRALLAAMITSAGCVMTSINWLVDPRVWAMMVGVLLLLLLGIIGMAFLDLFSVGLREMTKPNPEAQQAMLRKYLELHQKRQREQTETEAKPSDQPPQPEHSGEERPGEG